MQSGFPGSATAVSAPFDLGYNVGVFLTACRNACATAQRVVQITMTFQRAMSQHRFNCYTPVILWLLFGPLALADDNPSLPQPLPETPGNLVAASDGAVHWFESKVRPIFAEHCYECHSSEAATVQGGLRLDSVEGIRRGGDSGPIVVPHQPDQSLLIEAIRCEAGSVEMPPTGKMEAMLIERIIKWVADGAELPAGQDKELAQLHATPPIADRHNFWSFQSPRTTSFTHDVPSPWVHNRIDRFVLERLHREQLVPASPADRRTLLRRAYFDLIGLPPSWDAIQGFEHDSAPDAFTRRVDQLLSSPQYGERWGRHWLDLARYCDQSAEFLPSVDQAWRYRDWVIEAFNRDVPYDRFVQLQLAADHMPDADFRDVAALGFLGLSPVYFKELQLPADVIKVVVADEWEERIDAVGRTFLGLSLACARCHDHKFDPVSTEDYYALASVIAGTRLRDRPLLSASEAAAVDIARDQIFDLEQKIEKLTQLAPKPPDAKQQIEGLRAQISQIQAATPQFDAPYVHAVDDATLRIVPDGKYWTRMEYHRGEATELPVHIRGNPLREGNVVQRRFLSVFISNNSEPPLPWIRNGRLELATAIVQEAAPLTARVIVNRVWQHHFGRGLVDTPSDFGVQGARPSHPELLDDLTARFMQEGWSLKWLHRQILLSATWQQSTQAPRETSQADPENRLLGRMSRRRLELEPWRDAMLSVVDRLETTIGGAASDISDPSHSRRTIYGTVDRYELNNVLRIFDLPEPSGHSAVRFPTTTPLRQLFVLNSPFLAQQASHLTTLLQHVITDATHDRLSQLYLRVFGRTPTSRERELAQTFLAAATEADNPTEERWRQFTQALLSSNEFLFLD